MAAHTKIDLYQMQSLPLDAKIRMTARQAARELAAYFASSEYCKTKTELLSWKKKIRGLQTMY